MDMVRFDFGDWAVLYDNFLFSFKRQEETWKHFNG